MLWYIQGMEYCATMTTNQLQEHATTWVNLDYIKQTNQIAEGCIHHANIYKKMFNMQNSRMICLWIHIHTPMGKINGSEEGRERKRGKGEFAGEFQCISFKKIRSKHCKMLRINKSRYRHMFVTLLSSVFCMFETFHFLSCITIHYAAEQQISLCLLNLQGA